MSGNEIDPVERDFLIRTIIGEAANQPDMGKAAVAHVVLNRVNDGGFQGDNIQQVVTAPKQFEPWGTRAAQLKAIPPTSPQYQDAAAIADGVLAGMIPDPTGGATHFANVKTVAQRGDPAGRPGGWLSQMGNVTQIGDHTFGNGHGRRTATTATTAEASKAAPATTEGAGDASAAVGGGIISGIPIVGAPLKEGVLKGVAGIRSLQSGDTYENELTKVRQWDAGTEAAHPYATAGGNALGAVAATVPLMAVAPAAFGIGEGAMAARTAASALTGAGLGGADAASRSAVASGGMPSGADVVKGAAVGGAFGAAGPVGGQLIGTGANKLYDAASNMLLSKTSGVSTGARNALMAAMGRTVHR
jgi:hypothetical protein